MSKKIMKKIIPSLLHIKKGSKQQQQRPSSCNHHPDTLSFRCPLNNHDADDANIIFKTHNSIFHHQDHLSVSDSCLTSPSDSDIDHSNYNYNNNTNTASSSMSSSSSLSSSVETIIRGAVKSSDRLFFEPEPRSTSSILLLKEEAKAEAEAEEEEEEEEEGDVQPVTALPFKESVALALESEDPYWDFKESMREMVESLQGLKNKEQDWESLEELLGWYLRMNKRMNHGIIVGAFVDLLLGLAAAAAADDEQEQDNNNNIRRSFSSSSSSYSSADSCFSSPRSVVADEDFHLHSIN